MTYTRYILLCAVLSACSGQLGLSSLTGSAPSSQRPPSEPAPAASAERPTIAEPAASPSAPTDSGPSPAYIAERRKECTFRGAVNEGCVALYLEVVVGDNPLKISRSMEDELRRCFYEAASFEQHKSQSDVVETKFVKQRFLKNPEYDNKYATACIAAATAVQGPEWVQASQTLGTWSLIQADVDKNFESKCGYRAEMHIGGRIPSLRTQKRSRKSGVFYEGVEPMGSKLIVYCNGTIERRLADGEVLKSSPVTWEDERKQQTQACRAQCEGTRLLSGGDCWQLSKAACSAYCSNKCDK